MLKPYQKRFLAFILFKINGLYFSKKTSHFIRQGLVTLVRVNNAVFGDHKG